MIGTVFELPKGSGTITTLASFNGSNGSEPLAGLIMDSNGNLYGTTSGIHAFHSDGTVFELAKGSHTVTTRVTFNGSNGSEPLGGLIMDSSGNLYGTTTGAHDPNDYGTVYELVQGSTTVVTLATFDGTNGSVPECDLIMDGNGNLFGTTTGIDDASTTARCSNFSAGTKNRGHATGVRAAAHQRHGGRHDDAGGHGAGGRCRRKFTGDG